ncbi:MAG: PD-(D/E)XK nuclease family protein [Flavobacteriales bacterium]
MAQAGPVKPFLRQVAADLLRRFPDRIDEEVLVLPSQRAARFLQRYLGAEAGDHIWSPRVLTMDEFIHQSHSQLPADPIATYFELYDVYAKILGADASGFEGFIKWGRTLLQDLDEVDRYLIPPGQLFSDLRKIKEIEDWSFDREELSPYQNRYLDLWTKLGSVHEGLKEALSAKGQVLKGEAYRSLAEDPKRAESWSEKGRVHFIGLNALSRAEERIIAHLVKAGKAELHFDADPYYLEDPAQEAGHFLRQYRKTDWGKGGFRYRSGPMGGEGRKMNAIGVNGRIAQAKTAGRILEKEIPDEEGLHAALVLPDEALLQPVLHSVPSSVGALNVTMGFPLDRTILHRFFRDLFQMHRHYLRYRDAGGGQAFYHRDLFRVLEHPYMDALFQEHLECSSRELIERIRERNRSFLDRDGILSSIREMNGAQKAIPDAVRLFFEPLGQLPEGALQLQEKVLDHFREILREKGDALDQEDIYEYARVLKRIRALFGEGHRISTLDAYERILGQVVEGEELSFTGEPLKGVQVMGMLETRAIDLSHIILLSANETVLPKARTEASLIPQDLRAYYKMPTRHEKDAVFAYHFYRMIQRADRVDLLYDSDPDGPGGGEKSRFLTQLLHEAPHKDEKVELKEWSAHVPLHPPTERALSIPKDERIQERLREWASKGVSPTALSTWIEDPYQFYRKYILRVPEPDELEESVDARSLGDIIHDSLYELYKPFEGRELPADAIQELVEQVPSTVRKHFSEHYDERDMGSGKNYIMLRVIEDRVKRFLNLEEQEVKKGEEAGTPLIIEKLELPYRMELSLELGGEPFTVRLRGTPDRIDRIGDRIRLIDLKTGNVEPNKLKVGDPDELFQESGHKYALQLLFYGLLYYKEEGIREPDRILPCIIGFRDLGNWTMGLGIKERSSYASMNELLEAFEGSLREKLSEILDPEKPIEETPA